jgi:hypothetical protein
MLDSSEPLEYHRFIAQISEYLIKLPTGQPKIQSNKILKQRSQKPFQKNNKQS